MNADGSGRFGNGMPSIEEQIHEDLLEQGGFPDDTNGFFADVLNDANGGRNGGSQEDQGFSQSIARAERAEGGLFLPAKGKDGANDA